MTSKDKSIVEPPSILKSSAFEADVVEAINTQNARYQPSRYGHSDVREALNIIYRGKCAYCERKIKGATPHVDHYRPINSYNHNNNTQNHSGYYWLGYEWTNLLLACPSCNGSKSSKFFLQNPHARKITAPTILENGSPNYEEHKISSLFYQTEQPLLINPEVINPDNHLTINCHGLLESINGSLLGESTIDICKLNEIDIYIDRADIINDRIIEIEDEIWQRYREDGHSITEQQYKERLFKIFKKIISQTHPANEYNMLGRCMIERFDEFILEEIQREFRNEVRNYFIEFLNE